MAEPYFVTQVSIMPGIVPTQTGTFYAIESASSAEDACQQAAKTLMLRNEPCPPFLLAMPASGVTAVGMDPGVPAPAGTAIPAPSTPVVTAAATDSSVTLSWAGDPNTILYSVERGAATGGPYVTLGTQRAAGYVDTAVTPGDTYYYVVGASNVNGQAQSAEASAIVLDLTPPSLAAAAGGTGNVSLSWTSAGGSSTEYAVERASVSGGPYTQVAQQAGLTYLDTGLTSGSTYYYVVRASDATGQAQSQQVGITAP